MHNEEALENDAVVFQDMIGKTGIVLPVASLLNSANDNIVREALAFLVSILEDGNDQAQASFMNHFISSRDETFFRDITTRMRDAMEFIVEVPITQLAPSLHAPCRTAFWPNRLRRSCRRRPS